MGRPPRLRKVVNCTDCIHYKSINSPVVIDGEQMPFWRGCGKHDFRILDPLDRICDDQEDRSYEEEGE